MRQVLKQRLNENAPASAVSLFTVQAFVNMVMNFGFHKRQTYAGLPERPQASKEGLCSMNSAVQSF
jgi:hypothetical protein